MNRVPAVLIASLVVLNMGLAATSQTVQAPKKSKSTSQPASSASALKAKSSKPTSARKATVKTPAKQAAVKRTASKSKSARKTASRSRKPAPQKLVIQEPAVTGLQCAFGSPARGEATACVTCSEQALARAHSLVGLRYKRGGTSVETGFDCSGFVRHVFGSSCQLEVPRSASAQYQVGLEINRDELMRGDLVFFRSRRGWHVGIYTGDGNFIHSPNRRDSVKVSSLSAPYYRKTYLGARRLMRDLIDPLPQPASAESATLVADAGLN
jgi:cell wall-associated NlpC family hydrolase